MSQTDSPPSSSPPSSSSPSTSLPGPFADWFSAELAPSDSAPSHPSADPLPDLDGACWFFDASAADAWVMTGEDRARFLNGQVTCDTSALGEGEGVYGFSTTAKGRVEHEIRVLDLGDRFWLALSPGQGEAVRARLEKYVIIDRVGFEPLALRPVRLVGEGVAKVLAAATPTPALDPSALATYGAGLPNAPWSHVPIELGGVEARLVREPDLVLDGRPAPHCKLWLPVGNEGSQAAAACRALVEAGATPATGAAWERLRVLAGLPVHGADFGLDCFPQETGLEAWAVSYTKGCYLGQEVVARIHYRGGVRRAMRRVIGSVASGVENETPDGPGLEEAGVGGWAGARLMADGKEVGTLGSTVRGRGGEIVGLAVVRLEVEPGATVTVLAAGGDDELGSARIEAL